MVVHIRHASARGLPTRGATLLRIHAVLRASAARAHHDRLRQLAPLLAPHPDTGHRPDNMPGFTREYTGSGRICPNYMSNYMQISFFFLIIIITNMPLV